MNLHQVAIAMLLAVAAGAGCAAHPLRREAALDNLVFRLLGRR